MLVPWLYLLLFALAEEFSCTFLNRFTFRMSVYGGTEHGSVEKTSSTKMTTAKTPYSVSRYKPSSLPVELVCGFWDNKERLKKKVKFREEALRQELMARGWLQWG